MTLATNAIAAIRGRMGWHAVDPDSGAQIVSSQEHAKIHDGKSYYDILSTADLGAETGDIINLNWKTPASPYIHLVFIAFGTAGMRVRLIEAPTGGAATPGTSRTLINKNRNSTNTSSITDLAGTPVANKVSPNATLATGGTTLWDQYLEGVGGPLGGGVSGGSRDELELKISTQYQLSIYGAIANPAGLYMSLYED